MDKVYELIVVNSSLNIYEEFKIKIMDVIKQHL